MDNKNENKNAFLRGYNSFFVPALRNKPLPIRPDSVDSNIIAEVNAFENGWRKAQQDSRVEKHWG